MPPVVGDVFGLGDVFFRESTPVTVGVIGVGTVGISTNTFTPVTVSGWSDLRSYGWFGGGFNPATLVSTVDRIDFSNDLSIASLRGSLSSARGNLAATGNSNYGWFGGGFTTVQVSTVDRIDFSNEFSTASVRGSLSSARYRSAATGNSNYGWFGGGVIPTPAIFSTVDRIDFSNDSSTASVRGPLSAARANLAATGNSNYGWFGSGNSGALTPNVSIVNRIDFSNDASTASVRGPLSLTRHQLAAIGNSNYGWVGGGFVGPTTSTVNRIDFSNDSSTASVRGPLSSARYGLSAIGNSNYGWFGAGRPGPVSTVDRIDFSNDASTASVRGPLSSARGYTAATSGQAKGSTLRLQKGGNFGWFGSGNTGAVSVTTVDRVNFSNDLTTASVRGPLSIERTACTSTMNNSNYGWFCGGIIPTPASVTTVDRIDFSNDLPSVSIRGPISTARNSSSAVSNSNYGWMGGGSLFTTVDRIDFYNDFSTAIIRGPLNETKRSLSATGNIDYGWFGGGISGLAGTPMYSSVDRIDFSNDSVLSSIRSPLIASRYRMHAVSNSYYGWFTGGAVQTPVPSTQISTVERINFSNDLISSIIRGPFSSVRSLHAATSNSSYGWFGGGFAPDTTSTIDRMNFFNDSVSATSRGLLSLARQNFSAVSNTPVG